MELHTFLWLVFSTLCIVFFVAICMLIGYIHKVIKYSNNYAVIEVLTTIFGHTIIIAVSLSLTALLLIKFLN